MKLNVCFRGVNYEDKNKSVLYHISIITIHMNHKQGNKTKSGLSVMFEDVNI